MNGSGAIAGWVIVVLMWRCLQMSEHPAQGKLLKGGMRGGYKALCCPARNDLRCTTFSKSVGKKHPILKAPRATLSARFLLHRLALHSKQTILT